jgi:hypothetical protein
MLNVPAMPTLETYLARGFHLFPLALRSKAPMIAKRDGGRGCLDAVNDLDQLRTWWTRWPRANIGIATGAASGITVIDIDPANGGEQSVTKLAAKGLTFPPTLRAVTPNGGWHLVYQHRAGIKNWSGKIAPGIDTRSDGGFIVGAPSRVTRKQDGVLASYAWIDPATGEICEDGRVPEAEITPFPEWAAELCIPKPVYRAFRSFKPMSSDSARAAIERQTALIAREGEGNRNGALSARAFYAYRNYVRRGVCGEGELKRLLHDAALANGLTSAEALKTIDKAFRAANAKAD